MPQITFEIDDARAPALFAAIQTVHPKPAKGAPQYVEGETDAQWTRRVLQMRFSRMLVGIMKKAQRKTAATPDPGLPPWA